MNKNLKSDGESKNEKIQTESIKLKFKRKSTANAESKRDSSNNNVVKLDSRGDEIVYEVRHRFGIKDTIQYVIVFMFGIMIVYVGIEGFVLEKIGIVAFIILMLLGIPSVFSTPYRFFYKRKDRFYVTNSGIGFERRKRFRIQKRFFKFGEVGLASSYLPAPVYFETATRVFIIYPISITYKPMAFPRLRDKNYKHYVFCRVLTQLYLDDIKTILVFIRQKTKEALESQGIEISDSELKDKIKSLTNKGY